MLNLKRIIREPQKIKMGLTNRNFNSSIIDEILTFSNNRTELMTLLQAKESEKNKISKEIGALKSKGEDVSARLKKVALLKDEIQTIKENEVMINNKINEMLSYIPNVPLDIVPVGKNEISNKVIEEFDDIGRGKVTNVKPHYKIGVDLDIIDFEKSVDLSGTRFWSYKNNGAKLLRALQNFMLDEHTNNGYQEIIPPLIVKSDVLYGTGQLPKFEEDLFKLENDRGYLIPTAEVPLTNFYRNSVLNLSEKTLMLTAFTPCFRSEAGSGGKDMRGLIRSHQFYKVEVVRISSMENIKKEFNETLNDCANILKKLELPFQMIELCTGDIGFSSERTIDLEVWIPSEKRYRECSSVSSFGDFQARRAMLRYKDADKKNQYAGTINGSGVALDRVVAAILENYQNKDGTISIPKALQPYMNNQEFFS